MELLVALISSSAFAGVISHLVSTASARQETQNELRRTHLHELRRARFDEYQKLWKHMEPLALYAPAQDLDRKTVEDMSTDMRAWYFGGGGLVLSTAARDRYFDLQNQLQLLLADSAVQWPLRKSDERYVTAAQKGDPVRRIVAGKPRAEASRFTELQERSSALRTQLTKDVDSRSPSFLGDGDESMA